jgi:hypothetical protein
MATNADHLHQWAQGVLSQKYTPEQIREMGKGKPKLAPYIPPTPYALEYAAKWMADQQLKTPAAEAAARNGGRLARAKLATAAEQERAERAEWKAKGLEAQVNGLLRGQRS